VQYSSLPTNDRTEAWRPRAFSAIAESERLSCIRAFRVHYVTFTYSEATDVKLQSSIVAS